MRPRLTITSPLLSPRDSQSLRRTYTSAPAPPQSSPLAPRPPRTISLAGTIPYHTSYFLLYARDPPRHWPSIFVSHLYMEIQRRLKEHGAIVNFSWRAGQHEDAHHDGSEEPYHATLWKRSLGPLGLSTSQIDIPIISKSNVEEVVGELFGRVRRLAHCEEDMASSGPYFYVCTHGMRDCRCGVRGGELAEALRKELSERGILFDRKGNSRVGEVGHVGGHKNAPNLLVFPHGDWYGNLEPSDLPTFLDHYLHSLPTRSNDPLSAFNIPNRLQWRGRIGMTKQEQIDAFDAMNR